MEKRSTEQQPSWWAKTLSRFDTLTFSDPALEQAFSEDYLDKSIGRFRLGMILGIVLYGSFGFLDGQLIPEIRDVAWFIRFGVVLPLTLWLLIVSYSKDLKKHLLSWFIYLSYVSGIGINIMVALAYPPGNYLYYAGLLLSTSFYFTFLQFPFRRVTVMCWVIFVLYEITAIWISHFSMPILLNNTFFFVAFNITGMSASYSIERYKRSDFLQQRTIREQTERLREAMIEIQKKRFEAEEISRRDSLTNLFNRRHFFSIVEHERNKFKRYGRGLAVMLLDIDYFKSINDTFGHSVGDKVLQITAGKIQDHIRQADVACRYGGDEFAALFPETNIHEAYNIAQRLCDNLRHVILDTDKAPVSFRVSVGVAALEEPGDINELMERVDKALYEAKKAGRDQVKAWGASNA